LGQLEGFRIRLADEFSVPEAVNQVVQMKLCVVAPGDCNESMWPAQIVADPDIAGIGVCGYQSIHFVCFYLQDYSVGN
jgi:hypothetical protein